MSDKAIVSASKVKAIADAIRSKASITDGLLLDDMPNAINGIEGGGAGVARSIVDKTITEYRDEKVTSIGAYALAFCAKLKAIDTPNATTLGHHAFSQCSALPRAVFPKVTSMGSDVFTYNSNFAYVEFGPLASIINWSLANCGKLTAVVLRRTDKITTLANVNGLTGTPISNGTGYVYVPRTLVDSYKVATNWTTYANQIRAIEDYPEVTGG